MGDELLPCPFCGGEAKMAGIPGNWFMECEKCHVATDDYTLKARAIEAWNTRAERTCRNELDDGHFGCSVCGCHVRNLPFGSTYVSDGKRWYSTEKRTLNYCPHCGAKVVEE